MTFAAPQFVLLVPIWLLIAWRVPRLELWRPIRALLLLILTLLLCDPRINIRSQSMDLWVLFDRSLSARELVESKESEWRALLHRSRPSAADEIRFLDYAAEVQESSGEQDTLFAGNRSETRTALALHEVLARVNPLRQNRVLLFTDGYSTESLSGIGSKFAESGTALDYLLVRAPRATDFRIASVDMPERTRIGEPFAVEIKVTGDADVDVPILVTRDSGILFSGKVSVQSGTGYLRFSDRIARAGAAQYQVSISPETDAHAGNNQRERWIEVISGPRVVLITSYQDDPLATTLRKTGLSVDVVEDLRTINAGVITGAKAVILNNVPAYDLPTDLVDHLPFFVSEQGGGLLMVGGKNSFGSGGYSKSKIDPLLPVSMELKNEDRKLAVAMVIAMDRSGSMAMTTPSGHTKMQLANEGAANAVELLGNSDAVAVFAVDTAPHVVAPLLNVGKSRTELIQRIRQIQSMGGGIYVYEALEAAWNVLKTAPLGMRHVILFSDASDSENPGDYKKLIQEMRAGGATISVIGLGSRSDPDAALLEDIAKRGEGRVFFAADPADVPNVFAQETVAVSRASFVTEVTGTISTGRWQTLAPRDENWLADIDGYNLNYLRDGDEAALLTTDDYDAPLVAFGRRGIGRTAAIAFPMGGESSERALAWPSYEDFAQTLLTWIMAQEIPPGLTVRQRVTGNEWLLDLHYDAQLWEDKISLSPPHLVVQAGRRGMERSEPTWQRVAPGHYSVTLPLTGDVPARAALQVGDSAIPMGPVVAGADREWEFDPARVMELREVARSSGGGEVVDLSKVWRRQEQKTLQPIRCPLLATLLGLFLLDALLTRTGWQIPGGALVRRLLSQPLRRIRSARRRKTALPTPTQKTGAPVPNPASDSPQDAPDTSEPPEQEPDSAAEAEARRKRFRRAKRR